VRVRPHDRRGAHRHAEELRPPVSRATGAWRGHPGAVLFRWGELDLLRREAPHDGQSGGGRRPGLDGPPGYRAAGTRPWTRPVLKRRLAYHRSPEDSMAFRVALSFLMMAAAAACSSTSSRTGP